MPLCRECHEKAHSDESWLRATARALDKFWSQMDEAGKRKPKEKKDQFHGPKLSSGEKRRRQLENRRKRKDEHDRVVNGKIQIRNDHIDKILTGGHGLPRWKAELLNLDYPLRRGWRKKLIGKFMTPELYDKLTIDSV